MQENLINDDLAVDQVNAEWSETHTADPFCIKCDGNGVVWESQYGEPEVGMIWATEDCDCTKY